MMEAKGSGAKLREPEAGADQTATADLRLRLHSSQRQERAVRTEARRLARELALAQRLLAFAYGGETPARTVYQLPPAGEIPRVRATPLTAGALFVLDSCQSDGTHVALAGWAFVPVSTWNGLLAAVTVLFRHGHEVYAAAAGHVPRPDVAAHFATRPHEAAGGARGLASAGFACAVANDSLPRGVELEIILRLECAGVFCEQPTDQLLRL